MTLPKDPAKREAYLQKQRNKVISEDTRLKMSASAIGKHCGEKNPCFGKFGKDHPAFGRVVSEETREKLRISSENERNGMWVGDDVGYYGLHKWIKNHMIKPDSCQKCGVEGRLEIHNISGDYKRDSKDWVWLCGSCHKIVEIEWRRSNDAGSKVRESFRLRGRN